MAKLRNLRLLYKRMHLSDPSAFATCKASVTDTEIVAKSGEVTSKVEDVSIKFPITFSRTTGKQAHGAGWQVTHASLMGLRDD